MLLVDGDTEFPSSTFADLAADLDLASEGDDGGPDTGCDEVGQGLVDGDWAVGIGGGDGGKDDEGFERRGGWEVAKEREPC